MKRLRRARTALIGLGALVCAAPAFPAASSLAPAAAPSPVLDLGGAWEFKATDETAWRPAQVPGTVHGDLIRIGRIPDPFFRDNELKVQWVEKKEWEYRRRFRVEPLLLKHDRVQLECRGLDTIAEVYLNGRLLASTQNMFVEYEFNARPFLHAGENEIRIVFRSILDWVRRQNASDERARVLCPEDDRRADCGKGNSFFARKSGSHFGWNWGLRVLTSGIWRPIQFVAYDHARIRTLSVRQDLSLPERARLDVVAPVERFASGPLSVRIEILLGDELVAHAESPVRDGEARETLWIDHPRLWWPHGWGDQPLYTVRATLAAGGHNVNARSVRIGLRTVELLREKDARGEGFAFRVNGRVLFAKGANWIPADALPARLSDDHYRRLLRSALDANMNMLRIWGGGIYEPEVFYDFCDENGILLWHDFMFAVGPYLALPPYLDNVRTEIENVVLRLRHHPSIALWCGNNEQEHNMVSGQSWLKTYPVVTWRDYDAVFEQLIPQILTLLDPGRPYWPSSPHHPLDREQRSPDAESASGDAHDWSVWHGGRPLGALEELGKMRFVSEFGFAGPPVLETIRSFTQPEDRFANSYVMDLHDKEGNATRRSLAETAHNRSVARISRYLAAFFPEPRGFEDWIYVSQLLQAEAMRIGSEAARRAFPSCTGALYWQLDDNWPTLSKSSVDYFGRWKALHYFARRFFAPVLASATVEGTTVTFWAVNDGLQEAPATFEWVLSDFDGTERRRGSQSVRLPADGVTKVASVDFAAEVAESPDERTYRNDSFSNARRNYVAYRLLRGDEVLSANVVFFAPFKYLALPDPGLTVHLDPDGRSVTVRAERFAAFVEVGVKDGDVRLNDNFFHLLPGQSRSLELREMGDGTDRVADASHFSNRLYARSLAQLTSER